MASFEITYTHDHRQYARVVQADDFGGADRQCGPGEFVSGQIIQFIPADDQVVADMRLRIGEALGEVANG